MPKTILTFFLLFVSLTVWGQRKIDNTLSAGHQAVKGSKVSLIPPAGFTVAQNFLGFQEEESGSSIMVLDIPAPFGETAFAITTENLKTQGIEAKEIENLSINGFPALFVTGIQNAYGTSFTKYILLLGTEQETIVLNGLSPANLQVGEEVKKSLLSVFYEANKALDPFQSVDFSIDVTETKLRFAKSMSNSLIFTVDGKIPTASTDKTSLIIGKSFSPAATDDNIAFATSRIRQTPFIIQEIAYAEEIRVDGLTGVEILAKATSMTSGVAEQIYQVILFTDELYYILFGTTNDLTTGSVEEIKKAVLTFRRK